MVPYKQMPLPYVHKVAYISFAFFGYNGYLVYGYMGIYTVGTVGQTDLNTRNHVGQLSV